MSSNSNIQQNISDMIQNLQLRNELEGQHVSQLVSVQENLAKINELIREKMLLDGKNIETLEEIDELIKKRSERFEDEIDSERELNVLREKSNKLLKELEERHKAIEKAISNIKKAAWAGAAVGALNALGTTITTVFKVGKIAVETFINVMNKVGQTAFGVGKALLMFPWNMYKSLVSAAANASGSTELLDAIEGIRKQWGSFSNTMAGDVFKASALGMNLKNGALAQMQFFKESLAPGRSMMRVWQSLAAMLKDVSETLTALGPSINIVMNQFKEADGSFGKNIRDIITMQKGLGMSKEEFKGLVDYTVSNGKDIKKTMYDIGNLSLQLGDKFGVSSKEISRDVGKMMKDLGNFGSLTATEITAAATHFQRLGVEISKVTGLMDKFDQFEDAADSASKLSQAFGLQLDTVKLMRAENPAERQQMIAEAMQRAGISTDNLKRQSLKLLATTIGLDAATTKSMFSTENLGKSYDEVKSSAEEASKKQLSQEEILGRLADAIEKVNRSGGGLKDGFFKTFLKGIEEGIQRTPAFINMFQNLNRGLRQTLFEGRKVGESITATLGLDDAFNALGNFFKPESMKKVFGEQGFGGALKKIFNKDATQKDIDDGFKQIMNVFSDKGGEFQTKVYPKLQKLAENFGKIGKLIIEKIGQGIGDAFKGGAKLLKGEKLENNILKTIEESPWSKFVTPIWDGIKSGFLSMFDGFAELAPELLKKVTAAIEWVFRGIEYLFSDDKNRKALDKMSATGSYLSFDITKQTGGAAKSPFEESFQKSWTKLKEGVSSVFEDGKLWGRLKEVLENAWNALKEKFKAAWDYVAPYIKAFLAANLVLDIGKGVLVGAAGGFAREFFGNEAFRQNIVGSLSNMFGKQQMYGPLTKAQYFKQAAGGTFLGGAAKVAGGVGKVLAAPIALPLKAIGALMDKMPALGGMFGKLGSALGMIGPYAGIAIAAMGVIKGAMAFSDTKEAALKAFKERDDVINAETTANVAGFLNVLTLGLLSPEVVQNLSVQFMNLMDSMLEKLNDLLPGFGNFVGEYFGGWTDAISNLFDIIGSTFNDIFDPDMGWGDVFFFGIKRLFINALEGIVKIAKPFLSIIGMGGMAESAIESFAAAKTNLQKEHDEARLKNQKDARSVGSNVSGWTQQVTGLAKSEQDKISSTLSEIARFEQKKKENLAKGLNTVAIEENIIKAKQRQANILTEAIKKDKDLNLSTAGLEEKLRELNGQIEKDIEEKVKKSHKKTLPGAQTTTAQEAKETTSAPSVPSSPPTPPPAPAGQTGTQSETSAAAASAVSQIADAAERTKALNDKIEETKVKIEETKRLIVNNSDGVKKIADSDDNIAINTGRVVVSLRNNHNALMEGVNSIRTSTRNVNVNVEVAVQMDVKELEKIIVKQRSSLIRKAVKVLEGNLPDQAKVKDTALPRGAEGVVAPSVFGLPEDK